MKSEKTATTERRFLKQVTAVFGENRVLHTLQPCDLERYQVLRLKGSTGRRRVGARTINYELFCLRQLLKRAGLWSRFQEHYHRLPVTKGGPGTVLTDNDARRLFQRASSKPEWEVAFATGLLAYCTGMRGGEIRNLILGDLHMDVEPPYIRIRPEATKSRRGRDVPLNAGAAWAVRRLLRRATSLNCTLPEHFLLSLNRSHHTRPDDPKRGSKGFDPSAHQSSWGSAWRSLRRAAGIPKFRFHDFCHSFVTKAAEANVPVSVIQSVVGHLSPEMTQRYTHVQSQSQVKAVFAVEVATASAFADLISEKKATLSHGRSPKALGGCQAGKRRPGRAAPLLLTRGGLR